MAAITRQKGKRGTTYRVDFRDRAGKLFSIRGFAYKPQAERVRGFVGELERCRDTGDRPAGELVEWLQAIPAKWQKRLADAGLIGRQRIAAMKPLADHLEDFRAALLSKGTTQKQADLAHARITKLADQCGFRRLDDVAAQKVAGFLAERREGTENEPGVSQTTANYYLAALKQFLRWAVREGRTHLDPVAHMTKQRVTDRRKRRALSIEEQRRLIDAAETGDDWRGIPGPDRAMSYRTALGTGFRVSELAALRVGDFDLTSETPTVALAARDSKNRKPVVQPLPADVAAVLGPFLNLRMPSVRAFNMPANYDTADMLRYDLTVARQQFVTEQGLTPQQRAEREKSDILKAETDEGVIDFHSLRHSYGSNLARAGVSPKVAMDLMRHSDVNLTMRLYSHTVIEERARALDCLPRLTSERDRARATGTDAVAAEKTQQKTQRADGSDRHRLSSSDIGDDHSSESGGGCKSRKNPAFHSESGARGLETPPRPPGLEPGTCGLEVRCSIQLSYGRLNCRAAPARENGRPQRVGRRLRRRVSDGIRTRDPQDHNLVL